VLTLTQVLQAAGQHPLYSGWDLSGVKRFGDEAWRMLPTLDRDCLRRLPQPPVGPELLFYSSGTTGRPKMVRYSTEDLNRVGELCSRFARLEGVTERSRVMVLLPMALWSVGRITVDGHRRLGAEVFPVDLRGGTAAWQRMADLIRPTVISSTPSVLAAWAPRYQGPHLELVETTGEPLLVRERHLIEAHFGAFVHDAYGLSECVVGTECRLRDGFHYWPDATGVEVLEPEGNRPVPEGESGELVLTSFIQERMPILRFRSGDRGHIDRPLCSCGCKLPRVHLAGRMSRTLSLPRGVTLDEGVLASLVDNLAPGASFRYKGTPGSPATPFVAGSFVPALEILIQAGDHASNARVARELFSALPEVAELVHERDLAVHVMDPREPASRALEGV
jgi:phenylacetate-CoA ligase